MKFSEIKGEQAINVLAEILDPVAEIATDKEVKEAAKSTRLMLAKTIMKKHPKSILKIFALINGEDPDSYAPNILQIPAMLLELLNDPAFAQFFPSQGQKPEETSSGSAMENIEAKDPA